MNAQTHAPDARLRAMFPTEAPDKLALREKLLTYRNGASIALGRLYGADNRLRDLHRAILETASETAMAPVEQADLELARQACALMGQAALRLEKLWGNV